MACVSLTATIAQTIGETAEKSTTHPLAVFLRQQWAMDSEKAAKLAGRARFIGMTAGIIVGLYDIFGNAPDAIGDGKRPLGILYVTNGALGVWVAYAAFAGSALFWPLLVLSFAVGIAIAIINGSPLQQWISRCHFGKGEHYDTLDAELKAYSHTVGA